MSERGLALIREFEGLRLQAYPDPASGGDPWTIGYGHTKGVRKGDSCTKEQAEAWLKEDAAEASKAVLRHVVPMLSDNQLDALTSFVFNLGEGNFSRSTLLKKINAQDWQGAADEFKRWNNAAGKEMPGLTRRRAMEAALFLEGTPVVPLLSFAAAALPALLQAAPALTRIFGKSERSEQNAQALEVVAQIAKDSTKEPTVEAATQAIQSSPAMAAEFREAVHQSMTSGELVAVLMQAAEAEDKSRDSALSRNLELAKASGGRWLWLLGAVALIVIAMSYWITWGVLFNAVSTFSDETKAMLLGQIVILGFVTVLGFLYGSSISSRLKDEKS